MKIELILFTFYLMLNQVAFCQIKVDNGNIVIGESRRHYSNILKEERTYWIHFPASYFSKDLQPARYPVMYLLDGDLFFTEVSGVIHALSDRIPFNYVIPELILVGVNNTDRNRDLTPTNSDEMLGRKFSYLKTSGGNAAFLQFLKQELIPHIDSVYRTTDFRILSGSSFGGLAALNALFTIPETFNAYIAVDPSMWWDREILNRTALNYLKEDRLKGKILFVAQANTITNIDTSYTGHYRSINHFAEILSNYKNLSLRWTKMFYEDDNHNSVNLPALHDALRFIFKDCRGNWQKDLQWPEKLITGYEKFSKESLTTLLPPERLLSNFGMMAQDEFEKPDVALKYFEYQLNYYPKSPNAHYNMANYWWQQGDKAKALAYLEASLTLYPEYNSAKALKKIIE
jgi:hypothetical protein